MLKELKKLAQAATPGTWGTTGSVSGTFVSTDATYEHPKLVQPQDAIASVYGPDRGLKNAAYIAAANPATLLALIERYEHLHTTVSMVRARLYASNGDFVSINALDKLIEDMEKCLN